ncbi:transcriptional regulator [Alloactinosynnema sp. L-07]|nr:transcriptional regulator [Alloactinosynnema sp. L-07]
MIDLQVLGTVRLLVNGVPVLLEPRHLTVLVIAAVSKGQVGYDQLTSRFEIRSRATLRSYGAKVRARAGVEVVRKNVRESLQLALGKEQVDLWRFRARVAEAKGLPAHRKLPLLLAAAESWQGLPLAGLDPKWLRDEAAELRAEGARAFLELITLSSEHEGAEQAAIHAERANELFMGHDGIRHALWRAWSRCGQEQLILDDLRKREEASDGPSSVLTRLRADAKALGVQSRRVLKAAPMRAPHQLPPARAILRGRDPELAELDGLTAPDNGVRVVTVCGMGGVGKTELALGWAHGVAENFPDGVLFADLRGFSSDGSVEPSVVLAGFAKALGISGADLRGADVVAEYRTAVNTRAVLVVIDNARDHRHVADLVAAGEHSRTVITTRTAVTAPAVAGGQVLALRPIGREACLEMLREAVTAAKVEAEPFDAIKLMEACGGVPLVVELVVAQARLNPGSTLKSLLARLGSADALLGARPDGETALRDSLNLSYTPLSPAAAGVLQAVAIHPGPTVDLDAVVFLSGLPEDVVYDAVDELLRGSLLYALPDNRFGLHDLVRAFALERAAEERSDVGVAEVRQRLLGWLLEAARQCDRALRSGRELPDDLTADEGAPLPAPADDAGGRQWFDREHDTLLVVLDSPDFQRFKKYRWRLPLALCCYHTRNGPWPVAERLLASACKIDKDELDERERLRYQAICHRVLGNIQRKLNKTGLAEHNLKLSITLAEEVGDPLEVANGNQQMGVLQEDMGRWEAARDHAMLAGRLYAELMDERGVAATLPTEIHCHLELDEPERALGREAFAIDVMARAGTTYNQGALRRVLMSCHMLLKRYPTAILHGEAARGYYTDSGARINEARVLAVLAKAYRAAGRTADEREALLSCLAVYEQLPHTDDEDKRTLETAGRRIKELS